MTDPTVNIDNVVEELLDFGFLSLATLNHPQIKRTISKYRTSNNNNSNQEPGEPP